MSRIESKNLTSREVEVIRLIALGLTNNEIADRLFITRHTVKAHLENIYRKLSLKNKVQVAIYAVKHNLIDLDTL